MSVAFSYCVEDGVIGYSLVVALFSLFLSVFFYIIHNIFLLLIYLPPLPQNILHPQNLLGGLTKFLIPVHLLDKLLDEQFIRFSLFYRWKVNVI